jgi:hypothetical protein
MVNAGSACTRRFVASQLGATTLGGSQLKKEVAMSADHKTPFEHVNATLSQLKEMRHYSKNNVELLSTQWLLFDGELSKLKHASKIEDLMVRQGELHDALEAEIAELEELAVKLQPAPEEPAADTVH